MKACFTPEAAWFFRFMLVTKKLAKQPPDDPRDPDDFVDEPTEM